ncbi:MAG: RNA 3'-terminal phosphate cyclase [Candidatus Nanoarchaeia archaeon]
MITIDGSHGEGGGSILRQALALSLITQKPFRIKNIRSSRPNPGLNYQHLASVELAQKVSNAKVLDAKLGSQELEFYPGELSGKEVNIEIGTAGSVTLALQSVLLPCILSGKKFKFTLKGGTDVSWSPPADYFKEIFLPSLEDYGKFDCQVQKRGFYPRGGGVLSLTIQGNSEKNKIKKNIFGTVVSVKGIINTSKNFFKNNSPEKIVELSKMSLSSGAPVNISIYSSASESEGAGFLFYAVFEEEKDKFSRTGVSEIAKDEEELVKKIEEESKKLRALISEQVPVDENLADQLIPLLGIMGGEIKTNKITDHTISNIHIAELFLEKKFEINEKEGTIRV